MGVADNNNNRILSTDFTNFSKYNATFLFSLSSDILIL